MADNTKIEWTDATWNPVTGCSIVSPGCIHCYAQTLAGTRLKHHSSRKGLTEPSKNGPVFNGKVRFNEAWLTQPLSWQRPRRIFVCAHGDLFHENVPDAWIDRVFAVMALSPQHQFQVLTKRAERMREYMSAARAHPVGLEAFDMTLAAVKRNARSTVGDQIILQGDIVHLKVWPLPNVWLGVSAERQQEADERIPDLLATPAAKRFVSAEPLLGPIDLGKSKGLPVFLEGHGGIELQTWGHPAGAMPGRGAVKHSGNMQPWLDWVIAGGESGKHARPMHPNWARSLRGQCKAAGVPFFFKQWGEWGYFGRELGPDDARDSLTFGPNAEDGYLPFAMYLTGKKAAGRLLDGVEHSEFPA